jgi:aldose 1-epimerase
MIELKNDILRANFSPFGARLVSLVFGGIDIVAGAAEDAGIRAGDIYAGTVCGRHAGRISNARFSLDGRMIELTPTVGGDQLHGGPINFANTVWNAAQSGPSVRFSLTSPDGDQGFPGALDVIATYALDGNVLSLAFEARTTQPTVINLTNHTYWNLRGGGSGLDQEVEIDADQYLPLKLAERKLPTGEIAPVAGTRFDFRKLRKIGEPYDHCFVLRGERGKMKRACVMRDPASRRTMEVHTTECALQFYTADHWSEAMPGKAGPLAQYCSVAIEPQNFPDAPNHSNFPSSVLRPGEVYRHRSEWRFFTG